MQPKCQQPKTNIDLGPRSPLVLCSAPSVSQSVFTIMEKALVGAFSVIVQLHRLIVHSTSPAARSVTQGDDCFLDAK